MFTVITRRVNSGKIWPKKDVPSIGTTEGAVSILWQDFQADAFLPQSCCSRKSISENSQSSKKMIKSQPINHEMHHYSTFSQRFFLNKLFSCNRWNGLYTGWFFSNGIAISSPLVRMLCHTHITSILVRALSCNTLAPFIHRSAKYIIQCVYNRQDGYRGFVNRTFLALSKNKTCKADGHAARGWNCQTLPTNAQTSQGKEPSKTHGRKTGMLWPFHRHLQWNGQAIAQSDSLVKKLSLMFYGTPEYA